jgi:hypothetical protein
MTVGYPQDKSSLDARSGGLALQMRELLTSIGNFKVFLDSKLDAELTSLGYSAADITLLRASFTDLDNLRKVATGAQAQPAASNFLFNSNKIVGPN